MWLQLSDCELWVTQYIYYLSAKANTGKISWPQAQGNIYLLIRQTFKDLKGFCINIRAICDACSSYGISTIKFVGVDNMRKTVTEAPVSVLSRNGNPGPASLLQIRHPIIPKLFIPHHIHHALIFHILLILSDQNIQYCVSRGSLSS